MATQLKQAPIQTHADAIRAALEGVGIRVVDVFAVPANPRVYRARVGALDKQQLHKALPDLRRAMVREGYGVSWDAFENAPVDIVRIEILP